MLFHLIIEQQGLKEWQGVLICRIIHRNTNNNVALALKSHLIIKSLNLIDDRVLHTMIAILCALYVFYITDITIKIDFSFNLSYSYVFQYKLENIYRP